MNFLRIILAPWWALQRRLDMRILWPQCKAQAPDLSKAKAAFWLHAMYSPCWIGHYGEHGLAKFIGTLE